MEKRDQSLQFKFVVSEDEIKKLVMEIAPKALLVTHKENKTL